MTTIIQIIPCTKKLFAAYSQNDGDFTSEVICLALVESDDEDIPRRTVQGMTLCDYELDLCETSNNFLRYQTDPIPLPRE